MHRIRTIVRSARAACLLTAAMGLNAVAGDPPAPSPVAPSPSGPPAGATAGAGAGAAMPTDVRDAEHSGVAFLLGRQEGAERAEWPYEGVYRVNNQIPFGYRVGGTGICVEALLRAPGFAADQGRAEAVARAVAFICDGIREPLMSIDGYKGGYDVRVWGYVYGARALLALKAAGATPKGMEERAEEALRWYLAALQKIEIPEVGGWNYARKPGAETPCAASPFVTGPALQTLFEAAQQRYPVDPAVVSRGLAALERCRTASGNFAYSSQGQTREPDQSMPGAIGRMVCAEAVLLRAGRSSPERVQAAVERFVENWGELEKRRSKQGTHLPPYGVAPYYFFFGFTHAMEAVELAPPAAQALLRDKLKGALFSVRSADGSWNDRVFPRSASYGTAMTMLALGTPWNPPPARWQAPAADAKTPAGKADAPATAPVGGSGPAGK